MVNVVPRWLVDDGPVVGLAMEAHVLIAPITDLELDIELLEVVVQHGSRFGVVERVPQPRACLSPKMNFSKY